MSAIGRISGPLLKSNLIRNGIDLAFETDLLYLDVNNQKLGVKTTTPTHELQVNGTLQTTNLIVDNVAEVGDITIQGSTISTDQPYLNLGTFDNIVYQNKLRIDSIDIEGNVISTNDSNSDLELRPNGTGKVDVYADMDVNGSIHATGDISADGSIRLGDADTDNVTFNAEVASDLIPDQHNTYQLGTDPATGGKAWKDVWVNTLRASSINSDVTIVDGVNLTLRQGNIFYVAENGNDNNTGDHILDPVASIKYALETLAQPGDTVHIYPGVYTEEFPITVPTGVTVRGQSLRSVKIVPTTDTRYNDAFLLNGETTIEDVTVADFYSGGNYFEVTARGAGTATVNVGTAPFAHTYVSGGTVTFEGPIEYPTNPATVYTTTASGTNTLTINVGTATQAHTYVSGGTVTFNSNTYNVTGATYTHTTGVLVVTHDGNVDAGTGTSVTLSGLLFDCADETASITGATYNHTTGQLVFTHDGASTIGSVGAKAFLSNLTFSCNNDTRVFPDNGYAFRFATDYKVTSRSPYIKNITVITKGSTTTLEDPRGFNAGDAGKGAYIDGAYATTDSREAGMLFHSATFITPGVDAITCTNGVRVEWLNSFSYFANRGFNLYDSNDGKYGQGRTRVRLNGVTGTFAATETITFSSTDNSTVITGTIDEVEGTDVVYISGKKEDFIGFDYTPLSISSSGGATATEIVDVDFREFGAEVRSIGSASVYGNFGLVGDGPGVIMYAIGHNLAYIGNGKEITNDPLTVIQANEVVETNGAKIRYNSVDQEGDFRVGNLFRVDQATGQVDFSVSDFTINTTDGVTFNTNGEITFIDGTKVETGNWRFSGNTIETLSGDGNFTAASGQINLNSNVNVDGNLDVTGNVTIGGNITIGDDAGDTISIVAGIESDLVPASDDTYSLGIDTKRWSNLYVTEATVNDIEIRDNYITTTVSNANLELRANGTGEVVIPSNDVVIEQNLTVNGTSSFQDTNISGTFTLVGDLAQTGNYALTGDANIGQQLTVGASAQFEEILIDDNYITTTTSNADLELRASGTGRIYVPLNDVVIENDLTINGTTTTVDITSTGIITADSFTNNVILLDNNVIETTTTNTDLVLNANGTGVISIPSTDVEIAQDLTVSGTTDLQDTNITGTITHVGNTVQTGNVVQVGDLDVTGNVTISSTAQFENIQINDNFVTTTQSNSDLELRANGTGKVIVPSNDVVITGSTEIQGTLTVENLNSSNTITASSFSTGTISVYDNVVETVISNADLDLRANGTGRIYVPTNDVVIEQDLTVNGTTTLSNTTINGTVTHVGNTVQTGNVNLTGNLDIVGDFNVTGAFQFENILIDDNVITTTDSNSDLELRGAGTGSIYVPDNNVVITNNLTVDGTFTVGDIVSVGTITSNNFTTGDILVDDNFITTTNSNSNLELRANGTGSIIIDDLAFNSNTITVSNSDLEIITGDNSVVFDGTGEVVLPKGSDAQRVDVTGAIRWNTDRNRFEGYNGSNWINLAGVEDLDGNTKVTAELTEGANDGVIRFTVNGTVQADLDVDRFNVEKLTVDDIHVDGNMISTVTANTDLQLSANGTGSVNFENFGFNGNRLTNVVNNSNMVFETSGTGYYEFVDPYGIVLPVGDNATRPSGVQGMIRYNTADARVELYDGTSWVSVAGSSGGISFADAENIAIEKVLIFG